MNTKVYPKSKFEPVFLIGVFVFLAMILAACSSAADAQVVPATSKPADTQVVAVPAEAVINISTDPTLGQYLVDGEGMTLYIFTKDGPDQSNCDAGCLANWPPLLTQGKPSLGPGVDDSKVGSALLADGTRIVTYDKKPLYYWVKDTNPGDTTGQGVGSVWYVISPDGKAIGISSDADTTAEPVVAAMEPTINVGSDPILGEFLVDGKGMTLYIFTQDGRDQSNCDANCLAKWPPLLTQGAPVAGAGVDASQLGYAPLTDGSFIVTYDHKPLYYWVSDTKPGDTSGQGVGGVWFAMSPSGDEIDDSPQAISDPTPPPATGTAEATLNVASDPILGEIIVDGKGMTLYIYTRDTADKSNCNADCLAAWPPLLTQGSPVLGPGVDDSKVGSALLSDGTRIVTYNHMPLYYWVKDLKPGDTTGQGVGGVWYVIDRDGDIIGK